MTAHGRVASRLTTLVVGAGLTLMVIFVATRVTPGPSMGVTAASVLPEPTAPTSTRAPLPTEAVTDTGVASPAIPSLPVAVADCTISSMLVKLDESPAAIQRDVSLPASVKSDLETTYSSRQVLETAEAPLKGTAFPALSSDDVIIVRLTPSKTPILGPRPGDPSRIETCAVAFYDAKTGDWLMTYGTSTTASPIPTE